MVKLHVGTKLVGSKYVFKNKFNAEGKLEKHKAHLGEKEDYQMEGIDFGENCFHIAKLTSRFILSIATIFDLEVKQMDVKLVFLHGGLEDQIYMKQPKKFTMKGNKELCCTLNQSPRMWYQKFNTYILGLGFQKAKLIIVSIPSKSVITLFMWCYTLMICC